MFTPFCRLNACLLEQGYRSTSLPPGCTPCEKRHKAAFGEDLTTVAKETAAFTLFAAAALGGVVYISDRVPMDHLGRWVLGAVVAFLVFRAAKWSLK